MPDSTLNLYQVAKEIHANIVLLGVAGFGGALARAVIAPEGQLLRRLLQGFGGVLSAIFIGPLIAPYLEPAVTYKPYAWLAAGFLCAFGGEEVIALIQRKILGSSK